MPKNLAKEDANIGEILFTWKVKEYEDESKTRGWYVFIGVVGVLLFAFGLFTSNYLFVMIVVLFGIIMFLHGMQPSLEVDFAITDTGIIVGNKFYTFGELESYWLIYNPPSIKNLYFSFDRMLKHRLRIPLLDNDPRPIREFLDEYIEEDLDQEDEPFSDRLARFFNL
ncbi:MAG: hypothetical protein ABH832_03735 [bacterium]